MPPINNCANLPRASFDVLSALLSPLRQVKDVLRFAESQTPQLALALTPTQDDGALRLLLTRPSSSLAFQFQLSSLEPDGLVLAAEIWRESPLDADPA